MHDRAERLDAEDSLAFARDRFIIADPDQVYLDGNSLGRATKKSLQAVDEAAASEWAAGLVGSWHEWIELPRRLGAIVGEIVGAEVDSVILSDQTSLNLFKLASAALSAGDRKDIITSRANFPSDIYVLQGASFAQGGRLELVGVDEAGLISPETLEAALTPTTGLVSFSHVDFKTGALRDLEALTAIAHDAGALVLWDLSHSAGVVPIGLAAAGVDLAVGCTYKYLNGGPGAPAFLYVAPRHQSALQQPIQGWFSHRNMFAFDNAYDPAPDIDRFAVGTPPVLSMRAAEAGIALVAEVGVEAIRRKSIVLTEFLIELIDAELGRHGLELATPRDFWWRGGHVSLRHPDAYRIAQALLARNVVSDFREPDILRLAPSPLYTTFADVVTGTERLAAIMSSGEHRAIDEARGRVT